MHGTKSVVQPLKGAVALVLLLLISTAGAAAWADDLAQSNANHPALYDSLSAQRHVARHAALPKSSKESGEAKGGKSLRECSDPLVRILRKAGFKGDNLREAWAIAMRESGGNPKLGPGHSAYNGEDVGLFQFNRPTFSSEPWWDERKLLTSNYSARLAYDLSQGGSNWWLWGLDGEGNLDPGAYTAVWSAEEIQDWIVEPYQK